MKAFSQFRFFLSNDFSLCQVDTKLSFTCQLGLKHIPQEPQTNKNFSPGMLIKGVKETT